MQDRDPTIDPDAWTAYWTARQASRRAIAEPTGGVALVDYTDVQAAMRSIRAEMLR